MLALVVIELLKMQGITIEIGKHRINAGFHVNRRAQARSSRSSGTGSRGPKPRGPGRGLGAGLALAVGAALLLGGFGIGRELFITNAQSAAAAAGLFDILVRFVRSATRAVLALGVVIAFLGWCFGPSKAAVSLRRGLSRVTNAAGDAASSRGMGGGKVGRWAREHRGALQVLVGVTAAVVLIAWSSPTANVVLWIALAASLGLLLIEVLVRTDSGPAPAAVPAAADADADGSGSGDSDGSDESDAAEPADA